MANLQVKNLPDPLYRRIKREAKREGRTIREFVLEAVKRQLDHKEFRSRLERRAPVDIGEPASRSLDEARRQRGEDLGA